MAGDPADPADPAESDDPEQEDPDGGLLDPEFDPEFELGLDPELDDDLGGVGLDLETQTFGRAHEHYAELESTNDRALEWALEGAPHGALVTADRQLAGRGRRGRSWESPDAGDLYLSVVVRPAAYPDGLRASSWGAYSLAVGVALREGLGAWLDGLELKWPNDLLWRGRKLGGILCEGRWHAGGLQVIVVGVGINVGRRRFDADLRDKATSVALAMSTPAEARTQLGRRPILAALLRSLEETTADFARGGFSALRGRYEPHCRLLGREVVTEGSPRTPALRGVAVGLDRDGALLIAPAHGGPRQRVEAADVWLATER